MSAALTPAMEDYLQAILALSAEGGVARARDIASAMKVSRPSVTGALRQLAGHGLVNYKPYELITLTPEGTEAAKRVSRRHDVLLRFLHGGLGVAKETAQRDACRIEHGLSRETAERLVAFMEFLEERPRFVSDWASRQGANRSRPKRASRARKKTSGGPTARERQR